MADERRRKFFSGRSVEQAVVAAANYHGIDPSEIDYREIEKRHGFVRTRRNAVIAVDPDHPRKAAAPGPKERPQEPGAEARPEASPRRRRSEAASVPAPDREETRERETSAESEREESASEGSASEESDSGQRRREERPRRERGDRRGRGGRRGAGEGRGRGTRSGERKGPSEAAAPTPPWWLAEPVDEETEQKTEGREETEGVEDEEAAEGMRGGRGSGARGEERRDEESGEGGEERFRHVRRSEGLRRRSPGGEQPSASGGTGEGRRGGGRGRGRGRRGRGPEAAGEDRSRSRGRRRQEPPPPPPAPPEPRIPRSERLPREEGELADAAREALERLLDFVGVEAEADFYRDGERLEVELWGPDDHVLLEEEGQLLLAIEHLLPRMIRGIYGDAFPVRVDCNEFHAEREERLRDLARRTADEVRRRGRARTLEEMDPAERRIVHITLEDDPTVTTESLGEGYYKRLKVLPA